MPQPEPISTAYFLTRQTANLQEDFDREINISASFFLLYGEAGVGKTRFLNELVSSRFAKLTVHWVDCNEHAGEASVALEPILERATTSDVIVVDHFEQATNKLKHQLLQSWSTDGVDKKFSLIIATREAGLEEVHDLATRYRLKAKSFRLLPLTPVEMVEYCASTVFPLLPQSPLSMPKQVRRALKETRGVIARVQAVVEQHGKQMVRVPSSGSQSLLKPVLVVCGLASMLVLAAIAYHFMPVTSLSPLVFNQPDEEAIVLAEAGDSPTSTAAVTEMAKSQTPANPVISEPVVPEPAAEPAVTEPAMAESPVVVLAVSEVVDSLPVKTEEFVDTQGADIDPVVAIEPLKALNLHEIVANEPYSEWFQQELKRSRDWLESSERSLATIQIMSLRLRRNTDDSYLNYVETAQKNGIDVSQLRLYPTRVLDRIRFSVIYGDYSSLREANQSLKNLPPSLKAMQPISRSVGGILREIRPL